MVTLPAPAIRHCWYAAALSLALCAAPQVSAQQVTPKPGPGVQRPLVLVPGLLGSRLCRPDPKDPKKVQVVWGTVGALKQFPTIRLSHRPDARDPIRPCGVIREIVYLGVYAQDVYSPIIRHLEKTGYREGRDLFVFAYDWRRSAFDNARALGAFIRDKVPDGKVDILAHSMGALVARIYVANEGGERVARLFSAGAPFQGSVKVFQTVQKGWGALNPAMGGLEGFRRTMLSFPSVFELMPRYHDCCGNTADAFDPARGDMWTALHWEGVDTTTMPDLQQTFGRIRKLEALITMPMPRDVEDVLLVGLDQRTPQRAAFRNGEGPAVLTVLHSWAGDGTVIRDSAVIGQTPFHPTSFSDHHRILHDPQIQDFLRVALTESVARAIATVPVRERGRMLSVDGSLTELVGVKVEPDEPIYRTGDVGKVYVHLRLGDRTSVDPAGIKLTRRMADGHEVAIPLEPDPSASDPGNPFERSFVGRFEAGAKPGHAVLKAVLELAGVKPRVVETTVPVMAQ
ncbi:alpha/beta fold hydrolase [Pseudorhodoplanes sp.]|uniref:alpha/beta fold hydrolase n=1 Tax=Pseudorhodoplanes sp. TaxID=1934341 RepID=UPI00391923F3